MNFLLSSFIICFGFFSSSFWLLVWLGLTLLKFQFFFLFSFSFLLFIFFSKILILCNCLPLSSFITYYRISTFSISLEISKNFTWNSLKEWNSISTSVNISSRLNLKRADFFKNVKNSSTTSTGGRRTDWNCLKSCLHRTTDEIKLKICFSSLSWRLLEFFYVSFVFPSLRSLQWFVWCVQFKYSERCFSADKQQGNVDDIETWENNLLISHWARKVTTKANAKMREKIFHFHLAAFGSFY